MILRILLFISYAVLVSANTGPVFPAQTYPFYQQNGYTIPANQPNDITPYLQGVSAQNPMASMNLSPSNIRQLLLNKILSSPSVQTILDSNFKGYGSNLGESSNNLIANNPSSNYYAVPTNNLNYKAIYATKEDHSRASSTTEKPKKRKSKKKHKGERKQENDFNKRNDRVNKNFDDTKETNNKKPKKRTRKQNTEANPHHVETNNKENESNKTKTKRRKNKANNQTKQNPIEEDNKVENQKPRRKHKKKQKPDKDNIENIPEHQTVPNLAPKDTRDSIDLAHLSEGIVEENRIPRTPVYDENYFQKLFPEGIANNFMNGLPQFDNNPAMINFFANMFQSMMPNKTEIIVKTGKKRRKPNRNRKHSKTTSTQKNKNSTGITVPLPTTITLAVDTKADVVTTENTIYINEKSKTNIDPIPKEESSQLFDKTSEAEQGKFKGSGYEDSTIRYSENTPKDFDPIINSHEMKPNDENEHLNYGYIDDYYPLFTDSAAYSADNREVIIKNLGDTKYYYAMDKDNRRRFEFFGFPERTTKDYEINKKYDDIEKEVIKNENNQEFKEKNVEETQFRSPPLLELPNFETRRVDKSEINPEFFYNFDSNHRFVGDKSPSFSEGTTPYYASTKHKGIKSPKDIETVFARSKVVKYGAANGVEEDNSYPGTSNHALTDETYFKDGGTTYIMAKSLGDYPESFW